MPSSQGRLPAQAVYRNWHLRLPGPDGEPYSEDEALHRFHEGDPVTLLVGPPGAPWIVLTSRQRGTSVDVTWLDALGRPACAYRYVHAPSDPQWLGHDLPSENTTLREHLMFLTRVELHGYAGNDPGEAAGPAYRVVVRTGRGGERSSTLTWPQGEVTSADTVALAEVPQQVLPAFGEWLGFLQEEPQLLSREDFLALIG